MLGKYVHAYIPIYICPILAHTHCEVLWDKNSLLNCVVQMLVEIKTREILFKLLIKVSFVSR